MDNVSSTETTKSDQKSFFDVDYKEILNKRLPITRWLPRYKVSTFFQDLLAGITVSLTEVPQGIAYAGIAGLSPEYGLYSAFVGGFTYAIFGNVKGINLGPTSILALMLQSHVSKFGPDVATLMCFLSGAIIFLLGIFNLGFVIEFFSYPIIAAFTCAASLQIGSTQLNNFFGIPGKSDAFLEAWIQFFENIDQISKWDAILGAVSFTCLLGLRELKRFGSLKLRKDWSRRRNIIGIAVYMIYLARNAIVIITGAIIAYSLRNDEPFKTIGEVKGGFPPFEAPPFSANFNGTEYSFGEMASELGPSIIFIPIVALLECISITKNFANGGSFDATQEILTLGLANILSSFVHSFPITGSFTRSAINRSAGVRTPMGGVFTSIITLLTIAFLTPAFCYVPKATLAAVIICAMIFLFELEAFIVLWKNKKMDFIPFLSTLLCCLFFSLEYGILIGIAVNLLFVLYPAARPKITIVKEKISKHQGDIYVITPVDNLYFPAAENLRDKVLNCEGKNAIVIVDGKYMRTIDITLARSIVVFSKTIEQRGGKVIFWHFKPSVINVCLGLDDTLKDSVKSGELEDLIEEEPPHNSVEGVV